MQFVLILRNIKVTVKWSRYRPGVAQRVGRGIALLFHDRDTRRGWVVSSRPRPHFTPAKDPVPILQEAGWAPGPVWTGGKSRPHRDSIPGRPACSQSLYWLHLAQCRNHWRESWQQSFHFTQDAERFSDELGGCLRLKKDFTTGSFVLSNHFQNFSH